MMNVKIRELTENKEIMNRCRVTVWKDSLEKEPSILFMEDLYKSEHSPIRDKWFSVEIRDIKSWVATHLCRHSIGFTPYTSTQRSDRLSYGGSRDDRKQGELVNMGITLNAQAFINVSKVRLCGQASIETQQAWNLVLRELKNLDKQLFANCVPTCIYRGFCPEKYPCGRLDTSNKSFNVYKKWREEYMGNRPSL